jgi:P-type E1-E2 ATPase
MIKDFLEDFLRYLKDRAVNHDQCFIWKVDKFEKISWQNIRTGDIIKVLDKEKIPCDIVLLDTSNHQLGSCFVETSGLDGFEIIN